MPNLFVLPASNKNNLYLEILYKPLLGHYAVRPFSLPQIFAALSRGQKTIVHVHWEENVYGSRFGAVALLRMGWFAPLFLARALGARFVWTRHNLGSHDSPHPQIDALGQALMWRLAHAVIIQNAGVAKAEAARRRAKVVYIPHPNYAGVYGPRQPEARELWRERWGVGPQDILLLALGAIRPYKRLESLIEAIKAAHAGDPRLRLLIAGKGDLAYIQALQARAAGSPAVTIVPGFVGDQNVAGYLAGADYAVMAHGESSLTSGAAVLALSYGLPVVALSMPAGELVAEGISGYTPQNAAELISVLKKLPTLPRLDPKKAEAAVADATPARVAQEMEKLYTAIT